MAKLSLKDKVCILVSCAVVWTRCAAGQEYSTLPTNRTWDAARSYCQMCFKDLVTLTPENIQTIAQNLTSDYWVGLRENFSSAGVPWSRWANGDPLVFQNWYPGWPVFKSPFPVRDCCSCSCTCPATTTTTAATSSIADYTWSGATWSGATWSGATVSGATGSEATASEATGSEATGSGATASGATGSGATGSGATGSGATGSGATGGTQQTPVASTTALLPAEAACERSPMVPPGVPDPDENYIEDSCVAMLSFGAWVEKNCSDLLPFICYDDVVLGPASVANVTNQSAVLAWLPGPGNVSHYHLVVNTTDNNTSQDVTGLTQNLLGLTAGTLYSVQVFPVKCERFLNPQAAAFNTTPNQVENLSVTNVTGSSVSLSWNKPAGNVAFYLIAVQDTQIVITVNNTAGEVDNLTPGTLYRFSVVSFVSQPSNKTTVETYTKPGTVSDLKASNNTNDSLVLTWVPPSGNATGYEVIARNDSNYTLFNQTVTGVTVNVTPLPMGTKITLSVTTLANEMRGDDVTIVSYTAPGPISNLGLVSDHESINATWNPPNGSYSYFTVVLQPGNNTADTQTNLTQARFSNLLSATNYTVTVKTVSGELKGPPVTSSKFTLPLPPTNLNVSSYNNTQITVQWTAPANVATVNYSVSISSVFWKQNWIVIVENVTTYMFSNLSSGTRYDFEVKTVANGSASTAVNTSHFTDANKREIGLSMMCSSADLLLCDKKSTRESVFQQLLAEFSKVLGDGIFWKLKP